MSTVEIELKFAVSHPDALRAQLPSLGFLLQTPRTFEQNTLYDTASRDLREKRQILRIRQYGDRWTLTYKRPSSDEEQFGLRYKLRHETETNVTDGPALGEVFENLGYIPSFRYEKYREEWTHPDGGHLVIDETAIGTWAELEGMPQWIDAMLLTLNIPSSFCTTDSYGRIFMDWKTATGSDAVNMTFDEIAPELVTAN